jgi:hypothetical protein
MSSILYDTHVDPDSVAAVIAAIRCIGFLTPNSHMTLRIAFSGEECMRCRSVSEMFLEPAHLCAVCWTVLRLNEIVMSLNKLG